MGWHGNWHNDFETQMRAGATEKYFPATALSLLLLLALTTAGFAGNATSKQKLLDEWRGLTSPTHPPPRVYVKGEQLHFYFETATNRVGFSAHWGRPRIPTSGYKVHFAQLRLDHGLPDAPEVVRGWHEVTVIAGAEWHQLSTNLLAGMTPELPNHGIYYQGLLADRLLYRDAEGRARSAAMGQQPKEVIIERHCSMEETWEVLARSAVEQLARDHPGDSLFLVMAPGAGRFSHPLFLDRKQRHCVWLAPAALYDPTERGISLAVTAQGLEALLLESHGIALLKNPVSSAARLGDLAFESVVRFLRLPLPKPGSNPPPLTQSPGMDLGQWETWLDHYTGTRRQAGSLQLLVDGERFFPRFQQALAEATNHIHMNAYIFDKDDVAVQIADQLKRRSAQVQVKVILDRMSSLAAGTIPPATPLPEDFVAPSSITSYLQSDSKVRVRPFLNPWFSSDHSKVFLVDGMRAWVGGMNIGREYRYEWHDLMVEVTGPVVGSLEDEFRRQWAHGGPLGDLSYAAALVSGPKYTRSPAANGQLPSVRLLPTKTAWKPFSAAVQGSFRKARNYIYVENPYLFDKRVIIGLVRARNRGVDVRVILPRVNDSKVGGRSNLVLANYFLQHGVRVYFYPGMTHVKALLVDDWACLGSANLNHLSLRVCQEQNLATSDPVFAAQLKRDLFEEDFDHSFELTKPITVDWSDFLADLMLEGF